MKTTVSIPESLFKDAEQLIKRLCIPRSQLYARALEDYIRRRSSKSIKEALDEVYNTESSELDPVIDQLQVMALGKEEW